jgi:hypothetical protein
VTGDGWPAAALGPVRRMAVLATALPGAYLEERQVPASFEALWAYLSDIERSIPEFDETVAELRVTGRHGDRLRARARVAGPVPLHVGFDIDLRPGWCWMVARPALYVVGFAAEADGGDTRLLHVEALHVPGPAFLRRGLAPLLGIPRGRIARHVGHDLDMIQRALGAPAR